MPELLKLEDILAKKALKYYSPNVEKREIIYDYIHKLTNIEKTDKEFLETCYQKYVSVFSECYLKEI